MLPPDRYRRSATTFLLLLTFSPVSGHAAGTEGWRVRPISGWTEDDARQLLGDSPWVKTFTPDLKPAQTGGDRGRLNAGGFGVGLPGMGRRGMGSPGRVPRQQDEELSGAAPRLTLRWESALPVNAAELKLHDMSAPPVDEQYYTVAVYGVPDRAMGSDPTRLTGELKKDASIKRDGQKDIKPASVEVVQGENGIVIVYRFSRSAEIRREDKRIEFNALIGRLQIRESFFTDDMTWQGKIEL